MSSLTLRRVAWLFSLLPLAGCGVFRHVDVRPIATTFQRPSNVGAYVSVTDGETPLTELRASNFRVYENDQLVPAEQTQLTLLDTNLVAAHQVVLLVDMSAATTQPARTLAAKAALNFVQKVNAREAVAVFAFDGGATLVPIALLPRAIGSVSLAALESFTPRDPSRNLNGAVVAGLGKLATALTQSGKVVRTGTLVVYASGPDIAGRVDHDQAHDLVWQSPYDVLMIGVAEEADAIENLARGGLVRAQAANTLPIAFEEAGSLTLQHLEKHYLVSYCSPARAGSRRLRLEVSYINKEGEEHKGDFESDFNARGFGPGCNPEATPRFALAAKAVSAPAPDPEPRSEPGLSKKSRRPRKADGRRPDQSDDAPVAPPDHSGYAK